MLRRHTALLVVCALAVSLAEVASAAAPHVVVAVRSPAEVVRDIRYLATVVGGPIGAGISTRLTGAMERLGLEDVIADDRPCGLFISFAEEGGVLAPVGFVGVKSGEAVEKFLTERLHGKVEGVEGDILRVTVGDDIAYLRPAEGYVFASPVPGTLQNLPNPELLTPQRDFEIIIYAAEIPESVRVAVLDKCVAELRAHAERVVLKNREFAELIEYRADVAEDILRSMAEQIETIRIALWTDRDREVVCAELKVTALPETELARILAETPALVSPYASLGKGALAFAHAAISIPEPFAEITERQIGLAAEGAAALLSERGIDVGPGLLAETLSTFIVDGTVDYFLRVDLDDATPQAVGAIRVKSAEPIAELVDRYVVAGKLSAEKVGDYRGGKIYKLVARHPHRARDITVYLWTNGGEIWASAGEEGLEHLKEAVAAGQRAERHPANPLSVVVDLKQLAKVTAARCKRKEVSAAAEAALAAWEGKEDVAFRISAWTSGRSFSIRCEADSAVLAGVAAAVIAHEAAQPKHRGHRGRHHRARHRHHEPVKEKGHHED